MLVEITMSISTIKEMLTTIRTLRKINAKLKLKNKLLNREIGRLVTELREMRIKRMKHNLKEAQPEKVSEKEEAKPDFIPIKKNHGNDYCKVCGNVLPERRWSNDKSERMGNCCSLKCWKEDTIDNYVKKGIRIHKYAMSYFSPEEQKEIKRIYKEGKK